MHTRFFLINRSPYAMQKRFFQCERFVSATHIVSSHIENIPYASGIAIPFGPGLKNPMDLRFIFGLGMEYPIGIGFRFTRGIENPAGLMFIFGRGLENPSNFGFVFILEIKNRIKIDFIRPLVWPSVRRMQYAPTRTT